MDNPIRESLIAKRQPLTKYISFLSKSQLDGAAFQSQVLQTTQERVKSAKDLCNPLNQPISR